MTAESLAAVASAMADTTRARMLIALMDGRAWTAKELATPAGVATSSWWTPTSPRYSNRLLCWVSNRPRRRGAFAKP
ncbi:hypothetical protein OS121_28345 [Mycolicibacterium mucogenicum]|uniref:hypothetical protein n=1 Tax=Mycolicibacterium mucogenicum TaxID=56689 RepID=UPI002269EE7F|nr:hypothetical protein [Mycolicibacterium mucogenicum]MCX8558955.1 hypothetical protein [Mycolicibacterium mucogenicum]